MGEYRFQRVNDPQQVGAQRTSALRFADAWVQALFSVLVLFAFLPHGFTNREFRERLAPLMGLPLSAMTPGADQLPSAPLAPARLDRALAWHPPLSRNPTRLTHCAFLHAELQPLVPPGLDRPQPNGTGPKARPTLPRLGGCH